MKKIIVALMLFFVCGCFNTQNQPEVPNNNTVIEILEENKEDLNKIKNRTADDLELGDYARSLVLDQDLDDSELGRAVRGRVYEQSNEDTVEALAHKADVYKQVSKVLILVLAFVVFVIVIFLISIKIVKKITGVK